MKRVTIAGLVASLTLSSGALSATLVSNGNFETGTLSGWTASGNVVAQSTPFFGFSDPAYGGFMAVFNAGNSTPNGILTQNISTVVGTNYSLTFNYGDNGAGQSLLASLQDGLGGGTLAALTVFSNSTAVQLATINFTASSSLTTIRFADVASNNSFNQDFAIDNVGVSAAPVPEPASWAMMVGGFGLLGAALRRRKTAVRFA